MNKITCISHGKDIDGISSAAIISLATGANTIFADYGNLIEKLNKITSTDELYICDLGLNEIISESFFKEIRRIREFAKVHYIDHHPMSLKIRNTLIDLGVDLQHSTDECTSILSYMKFINNLNRNIGILAVYGAVTDYMDDRPVAQKIIGKYDRQFILLESTLLTHSLLGTNTDDLFREKIYEGLLGMNYPHAIDGVIENAVKGLEKTSKLMKLVVDEGKKKNHIAFIEVKEGSTGTLAGLLIGAFNVPVGIAYRFVDKDICEISLRGSYDFKYDLGKIVNRVTHMIGGSGGGHSKASGARIPAKILYDFIDLVEFEIDKSSLPNRR